MTCWDLGGPEAMYNREGNKEAFVYRLKSSLALRDVWNMKVTAGSAGCKRRDRRATTRMEKEQQRVLRQGQGGCYILE